MVDSRYGIEDESIGMHGYVESSSPTSIAVQDPSTQQSQSWPEAWGMTVSSSSPATTSYNQMNGQLIPISLDSWELNVPRGMKSESTYSWQETSFARRLFRHSHERCLDLLTSPTAKVDPSNNRRDIVYLSCPRML